LSIYYLLFWMMWCVFGFTMTKIDFELICFE
jgi:hypothetical protein